ncbi:Oidioi.mRNA.OKI2018_I69.chr1.g2448.t1.cds [Oikopleura dioica]|uniref:Oidioi.mRNA.OKI2018_I69.chr1.g2448.t1.cds n=1 Tax=Oikopleura dioica TaxID=34765 RepID=A0ABN7SVD9_OIKDI|nr:Oidioi.mRNA.OKI2018_I69.chr1.g2448.t1.cds [Oikopleura dioica]
MDLQSKTFPEICIYALSGFVGICSVTGIIIVSFIVFQSLFGCEVCYLPDRLTNGPIDTKDETALEEEVNLENELFPSSTERSPVIKTRSESRY